MSELTSNPYSGSNSSNWIQSSTLSLVLKDPDENPVHVEGLTSPIEIFLPRKKERIETQVLTVDLFMTFF